MRSPIQSGNPSNNPEAVARRVRYLTDDGFAERLKHAKVRSRAKAKQAALASDRSVKYPTQSRHFASAFRRRVEFHLSRGRDIGYIAVAENQPVSEVVRVVGLIRAES